VFGGTPVVVFGDTPGPGEGRLVLEWEAGGKKRTLGTPLKIGAGGDGESLRLIQGARLITDLESRYAAGEHGEGKGREGERVKKRLLALSQAYGLASREMGLVAVVERVGDRPGDIPVTRVVPVGLAQDVEMGGYFGQQLAAGSPTMLYSVQMLAQPASFKRDRGLFSKRRLTDEPYKCNENLAGDGVIDEAQVNLLNIASSLEPDGGMPGNNEEERVLATILAMLQFLAEGHSAKHGAFRAHVERMVNFLGSRLQRTQDRLMPLVKSLDRAGVWRDNEDSFLLGARSGELQALGVWDEVAALDPFALEKAVAEKKWGPEINERLKAYVSTEKRYTVTLKEESG